MSPLQGSPTIANDSYYSANSSGLFVYKFYPLCKRCFSRNEAEAQSFSSSFLSPCQGYIAHSVLRHNYIPSYLDSDVIRESIKKESIIIYYGMRISPLSCPHANSILSMGEKLLMNSLGKINPVQSLRNT